MYQYVLSAYIYLGHKRLLLGLLQNLFLAEEYKLIDISVIIGSPDESLNISTAESPDPLPVINQSRLSNDLTH